MRIPTRLLTSATLCKAIAGLMIASFICALTPAPIASANAAASVSVRSCRAVTVRVTSSREPNPAISNSVATEDGTVFLAINASKEPLATEWTLGDHLIYETRSAPHGTFSLDQARVDIRSSYINRTLTLAKADPANPRSYQIVCVAQLAFLSFADGVPSRSNALRRVLAMEKGSAWGRTHFSNPVMLDGSTSISLTNADASFDGADLSFSGILSYHDLSSNHMVTLLGTVFHQKGGDDSKLSLVALPLGVPTATPSAHSLTGVRPCFAAKPPDRAALIYFVRTENAWLYSHNPWTLQLANFRCGASTHWSSDIACNDDATYLLFQKGGYLGDVGTVPLGSDLNDLEQQVPKPAKAAVGSPLVLNTPSPCTQVLASNPVAPAGSKAANLTWTQEAVSPSSAVVGLRPTLTLHGIKVDPGTAWLSLTSNADIQFYSDCISAGVIDQVAFNQHGENWPVTLEIVPSQASSSSQPKPPSNACTPAPATTKSPITLKHANYTIASYLSAGNEQQRLSLVNVTGSVVPSLPFGWTSEEFAKNPIEFTNAGADASPNSLVDPNSWNYHFDEATLQDNASGTFLGYPYESCPTSTPLPAPPKVAGMTQKHPVCLQVHMDKTDDSANVVRVFLGIVDNRNNENNPCNGRFCIENIVVAMPTPTMSPSPSASSNVVNAQTSSATAGAKASTKPSPATSAQPSAVSNYATEVAAAGGNPFVFRFGAGEMAITQMVLQQQTPGPLSTPTVTPSPIASPPKPGVSQTTTTTASSQFRPIYGGFDNIVQPNRLDRLGCNQVYLAGDITISELTSAKESSKTTGLTPRLGIGASCTILSFDGFLPLQISTQSSVVVTKFTYAQSRSQHGTGTRLYYLNIAGSYTSGNTTIAFDQLGFRTFDSSDPATIPGGIGCVREWNEFSIGGSATRKVAQNGQTSAYQISGFCGIAQINKQLTALSNAGEIERLIGGAVTGISAFILGKVK